MGLFGFVFLCPAKRVFIIIPFQIMLYAYLPFLKLALFFQTSNKLKPRIPMVQVSLITRNKRSNRKSKIVNHKC
jgi:hypothetical protein